MLLTKNAIRDAIRKVLNAKHGRRVAMVAYVGADARGFLPDDLGGLRLYCWPQACVTNPWELVELQSRQVEVRLVDRLHMKLYWSELGGAVLGSANLTDNALGDNKLKEVAVHLPPSASLTREIGEIEHSLDWRSPRSAELKDLMTAARRGRRLGVARKSASSACTFADWHAKGPSREDWYVGWRWPDEDDHEVDDVPLELSDRDHLGTFKKTDLKPGACVLDCEIAQTKRVKVTARKAGWWIASADYHKTKDPYYGRYVHLRFAEPGNVKNPPFDVDGAFRLALATAIQEVLEASGIKRFEEYFDKHGLLVRSAFADVILRQYRRTARSS